VEGENNRGGKQKAPSLGGYWGSETRGGCGVGWGVWGGVRKKAVFWYQYAVGGGTGGARWRRSGECRGRSPTRKEASLGDRDRRKKSFRVGGAVDQKGGLLGTRKAARVIEKKTGV